MGFFHDLLNKLLKTVKLSLIIVDKIYGLKIKTETIQFINHVGVGLRKSLLVSYHVLVVVFQIV